MVDGHLLVILEIISPFLWNFLFFLSLDDLNGSQSIVFCTERVDWEIAFDLWLHAKLDIRYAIIKCLLPKTKIFWRLNRSFQRKVFHGLRKFKNKWWIMSSKKLRKTILKMSFQKLMNFVLNLQWCTLVLKRLKLLLQFSRKDNPWMCWN